MFLSLRLWLGTKIFGYVGPRDFPAGVRVSQRRMIKWRCQEPEVEAIRYVAAHTTIPIPTLHRVHRHRGQLALEMEFLDGCETLQTCWRDLSPEQRHSVVEEVSGYITQLRQLEPPDQHRVSSTGGGPCRDIRVGSSKLFGPFEDSTAFHEFIHCGIPPKSFSEKVVEVHERKYRSRFTHGDLGVQNILIRDGKVAAIIDWECAGWYPEYWEFTKAHYNFVYLVEFYEMLDQRIDRYDK